ncbi:SDR family NAD(P)-dependent oxidoreductase [Halomarina oriensis]|uniref:Glucose 1-dehydrogenase n=1 Tax=Halomarina oriensis TaxID=671145 RepID=A0A6B0GFE6_9EURY|nr:glucose 1-dehydrogenase [Halomarina oriensis]MWG33424.1 glucose 1-dehydrogenase [Halomarina oriensis]
MPALDAFSLDGKRAIVTGGSRGIGRAIAEGFAEAGAAVAIANRSADACEQAATEIEAATDARTLAVPTDVTDEADVEHLVERVTDAFGGVDLLVNNAGIAVPSPAEEKPVEEWRETMETNLTGVFLCAKHAGRAMIEGDGGSIVNVSSITAAVADPDVPHVDYHASKGGVEAFTRQLATEWGRHGVRVNNLAPGMVETEMSASDDATDEKRRDRIPLGDLSRPSDLVGGAVFLASDAAGYVTGATLLVDGGYTAT